MLAKVILVDEEFVNGHCCGKIGGVRDDKVCLKPTRGGTSTCAMKKHVNEKAALVPGVCASRSLPAKVDASCWAILPSDCKISLLMTA